MSDYEHHDPRAFRSKHGQPVRDKRGRPLLKYYLRRDAWAIVQSRLEFRQDKLLSAQKPAALYLSEEATARIRRSEMEREMDFSDKLSDPRLEYQSKRLPVGFKMTPQLEELASDLGPTPLTRVRAYLCREYCDLAAHSPQRARDLEESRFEACGKAEASRSKILKGSLTQDELYTKGLNAAVNGFMNKIRFG
jgi:hypothetical protein